MNLKWKTTYHQKHLQESYPLRMKDTTFGLITGVKFDHSDEIKNKQKEKRKRDGGRNGRVLFMISKVQHYMD